MLLDLTSEFFSWIRGSFLILAVYHFMIYLQNRGKLYLYYSLYLVSLFFYFCRHICPEEYQWLYEYINFPVQLIAFGFYVLFARVLLNTRKHIPDWDVLMRIKYKSLFLLVPVFILIQYFFKYQYQEKLYITIIPIFSVFALLTYFVLTKIKGRHVTYFIIGSLAYVIGGNLSLLLPMFLNKDYFTNMMIEPMLFTYIGAIIEVTMFSLIIGYKVSDLEEDKLEKEEELKKKKKEINRLKIAALQSQMDPHFLYNSLNSINNFVLQNDREKASDYITKFSRLIREILQKSASQTIPLSEELGILGLYVRLEQMRMPDGFDYIVTVDDEVNLDKIEVPPLFIQPYIENAIWHGFVNKEKNKKITVAIFDEDENVRCEIVDNGIGIKTSKLQKKSKGLARKSFGLKTSEDRIRLLHEHQRVYVIIEDISNSENTGTKVTIKFPKEI